jgi:3-phenylpropionate/trans-cinnamate dioxygenase ferredoxin reductase subunit
MTRVVIIGGSIAGVHCAESLRLQGFAGEVLILAQEAGPPYDRPPLTKEFLRGELDAVAVRLPAAGRLIEMGVEFRESVAATGLDRDSQRVLIDGGHVDYDVAVIASGSRARSLPLFMDVPRVHRIRTLEDAKRLRSAAASSKRAIVIGAGFIGLEVSASLRQMGLEVVVVSDRSHLLTPQLGPYVSDVCRRLHEAAGIKFVIGASVTSVSHSDAGVTVGLTTGESLTGDLIVEGVGAVPNTEWLEGAGLNARGAVTTDAQGRAARHVYAIGDASRWFYPLYQAHICVEHWTNALEQGAVVAADIAGSPDQVPAPLPYFWSDQHGVRMQFAGHLMGGERAELLHGDLDSSFVLGFTRDSGERIAAFGWNATRTFAKYQLELGAMAREITV